MPAILAADTGPIMFVTALVVLPIVGGISEWRFARSLPELRLVKDEATRRHIVAEVAPGRLLNAPHMVVGVVTLLSVTLVATVLDRILPRGAILILAGAVAGVLVPAQYFLPRAFVRKAARLELRREMRRVGIAVCLGCGYDLRGQHEPRCPECGEAFDPALLEQAAQAGKEAKPSE